MMANDLKRSLSIAGHRTSVSLEPEFWQCLVDMARVDGKSLARLIGEIDHAREGRNLSAAIRVYVLLRLRAECGPELAQALPANA
jgi:predicted DNA-binding ribbon-helix-helix protein